MPKKTDTLMTPDEQRRRFEEAARAIEVDGGLSPDEAAKLVENVVEALGRKQFRRP